jgi:flagellar hook-associated protein 2
MTTSKSVLSQSATFSHGLWHGHRWHQGRARHIHFFVEKLATASQTSYGGLPANTPAAASGKLNINIGDPNVTPAADTLTSTLPAPTRTATV